MTGGQSFNFLVDTSEHGLRLDSFVVARKNELTRNACTRLIKQGLVTVEGAVKKPSYPVRTGQSVRLIVPGPQSPDIKAQDLGLDVLYEDQDLIVINKPAFLVVHPGPGHSQGTVVNALLHHCKDLSGIGGELRPGIVHRLDKDTTGVLMAAKNDAAHLDLSEQFSSRTIKKIYLALVHGKVLEDTGIIDLPISRHRVDRKKMYAAKTRAGREAITLWKVKKRFSDATFLALEIKTGRTHQIRAHLAAIRHPVIGDPLYGGRKKRGRLPDSVKGKAAQPGRQMLHAYKITFIHPRTNQPMTIEAPMPEDMIRLADVLGSVAKN